MNDWKPRQTSRQLRLFPLDIKQALAETEVSLDDLRRWHKEGLLSFNPAKTRKYQPWHVAEARFVAGVTHSGLCKAMIQSLLSGLEAPYSYDPDLTAYNFARSEWQQLPAASLDDLRESFREEFREDMGNAGKRWGHITIFPPMRFPGTPPLPPPPVSVGSRTTDVQHSAVPQDFRCPRAGSAGRGAASSGVAR